MLKTRQKKPKSEILGNFFRNPVTEKISADLLSLSDSELIEFFRVGYEALQLLGSEVAKAGLGLSDPEKLIKEAGKMAPETVKQLGRKIEALAGKET